MTLKTLVKEPIVNDAQGAIIGSGVTLLALGGLLLGLF
jgi:hypothetical protein